MFPGSVAVGCLTQRRVRTARVTAPSGLVGFTPGSCIDVIFAALSFGPAQLAGSNASTVLDEQTEPFVICAPRTTSFDPSEHVTANDPTGHVAVPGEGHAV